MKQIIEKLMKHTRHAELDSASHSVILSGAKNLNLPLTLALSLKGRGESVLCAIPTSKSIKVVPTSTNRATCVAHDKNLSTYRLNVLKTDKTPTLSRICKFAYSSLTNSTLSQRERVKYGFTLAEVFSPCRKVKLNFGFTLAEVLITLGIIGIVAAVTIPTLVSNYRKHVVETSLKRSVSVLEQAIKLAEVDYGEISSWDNELSAPNAINKYLKPHIPGSSIIPEYKLFTYIISTSTGVSGHANAGYATALRLKTGEIILIKGGLNPGNNITAQIGIFLNSNKNKKYLSGKDYFEIFIDKSGNVGTKSWREHWGTSCSPDKLEGEAEHCKSSLGHVIACTMLIECNSWVIPDDYPIKF